MAENKIQLVEKYLVKAIDKAFAEKSKTAILENGTKFIDLDFSKAGSIRVANILLDGLSDYYRAGHNTGNGGYSNYNGEGHNDGYKLASSALKWQDYTLKYDRGAQFLVDEMDNEETAGNVIGNLMDEFIRTKVVPEADAIRFSELSKRCYASLGNLVSETPSTTKGDANEITHLFNNAFEWLTEHEVPEEDQVIFVSPSTWTKIRNTEEIYKHLTQTEYTSSKGVKFGFESYEGRPIIVVPSDRFYTDIAVGDNGYAPTSTSKVINYIVCSKKACVPVVKLQKGKIFSPDAVQDFDGYKINFRVYHDIIIPSNKIVGVYTSVGSVAATTKANVLNVALSETSVAGTHKLEGAFTQPAGINGTIVWDSAAIALGSTIANAKLASNSVEVGSTFSTGTSAKVYFAIADASGKALAVSDGVAVTKANS